VNADGLPRRIAAERAVPLTGYERMILNDWLGTFHFK
jgi:hypothetical protein